MQVFIKEGINMKGKTGRREFLGKATFAALTRVELD
jgi:hypothetical protein